MEHIVGRIAVIRKIERLFSDPAYRDIITDCLNFPDIAPRGLSNDDLCSWLDIAVEANHLRNDFAKLMLRLYKEVWLPSLKQHIRPSLSASAYSYISADTDSAVSIKLINDIWDARKHSGQISLPVVRTRKSRFPVLRTSVRIAQHGYIVLGFDVVGALRVKRLRPQGWLWSEKSGYEYPCGIKLAQTRNLAIEPLKQAANEALKAVADVYVSEHLRLIA